MEKNQKKQAKQARWFMEMLVLTAAVAVISAAVYFFLIPSHASVSSISGLAIVLSNFVPLSISAITMILNVILLVIGFFTCGKTFGVKTVYTSILLPVFLGIFERILPDNQSMTWAARAGCGLLYFRSQHRAEYFIQQKCFFRRAGYCG